MKGHKSLRIFPERRLSLLECNGKLSLKDLALSLLIQATYETN